MTWQQMLMAIQALGETSLKMRKPGDWYVSAHTSIANAGLLEGRYGNGSTPEEAVEDHWERITNLAPHEYVVTSRGGERLNVKWTGFMWEHLTTEQARELSKAAPAHSRSEAR